MGLVFINRQPIFNRWLDITGYELLYGVMTPEDGLSFGSLRTAPTAAIGAPDRTMLPYGFEDVGLEYIACEDEPSTVKAFIQPDRDFLLGKPGVNAPTTFLLPPGRVVLEVPEDISIDSALVKAIAMRSSRGYAIALTRVIHPNILSPLLGLVRYVKVSVQEIEPGRLLQVIRFLKQYPVRLVAEKVDTPDDFNRYLKFGFEYFQGGFLGKPRLKRKIHDFQMCPEAKIASMPLAHQEILRVLGRLQTMSVEFWEIEALLFRDVAMHYKLLRLINSAYYGLQHKITSVRQAMTLMGLEQLCAWVALCFLLKIGDKPRALISLAMTRARLCENLSQAALDSQVAHIHHPEMHFLVGLFSTLEAFMDVPLDQLTKGMGLSQDMQAALLSHEGELGEALHCTLAYERADWDNVKFLHFTPAQIRAAYLDTLNWINRIETPLHG